MKKRGLKAVWDKKEVMYKGAHIYFVHDFTFKTRQQKVLYKPTKLKVFYEEQLQRTQIQQMQPGIWSREAYTEQV